MTTYRQLLWHLEKDLRQEAHDKRWHISRLQLALSRLDKVREHMAALGILDRETPASDD